VIKTSLVVSDWGLNSPFVYYQFMNYTRQLAVAAWYYHNKTKVKLLIAFKKGLGLLIIESCDKTDYHNIWINDGSASMSRPKENISIKTIT